MQGPLLRRQWHQPLPSVINIAVNIAVTIVLPCPRPRDIDLALALVCTFLIVLVPALALALLLVLSLVLPRVVLVLALALVFSIVVASCFHFSLVAAGGRPTLHMGGQAWEMTRAGASRVCASHACRAPRLMWGLRALRRRVREPSASECPRAASRAIAAACMLRDGELSSCSFLRCPSAPEVWLKWSE